MESGILLLDENKQKPFATLERTSKGCFTNGLTLLRRMV
jgi:hypothetical protein